MNKEKIIANDKIHLKKLIKQEMELYGNNCDLNYIDVSQISDMEHLFDKSPFNGDISLWDVSQATKMGYMFYESKFNGDISQWNVGNLTDMTYMFYNSSFTGDISHWDVSQVKFMSYMFFNSDFTGDLTFWKPYKLVNNDGMFLNCTMSLPFWHSAENREKLINSFLLTEKLNRELNYRETTNKKIKI